MTSKPGIEPVESKLLSFPLPKSFADRPLFFQRDGSPYVGTREERTLAWARDNYVGNVCIAETFTPYGELLSTIWLGVDSSLFGARPVIFETALCRPGSIKVVCRYFTESEAIAGHERIFWQVLIPPPLRFLLHKVWKGCDL